MVFSHCLHAAVFLPFPAFLPNSAGGASTVANLVGRDFFNGKPLLAVPSCLFSALLFCIFIWGYRCRCSAEDKIDDLSADTVPDLDEHSEKTPQQ